MKKITLFSLLKNGSVFFCVLLLTASMSFAQSQYTIQLQGDAIEIPENITTFNWNQMPESSQLNNGYVGWIQFYQTPSQSIQDEFRANNYKLLEYIPNKAYLFFFPAGVSVSYLQSKGVRSIVPVESTFKLSTSLKNGPYESWAMDGDNILVTLVHHANVSSEFVIQDLARKQIALTRQYPNSNNLELSIPNNCLEELSNLPYVKWVELIQPPAVPEDFRARNIGRSNGLDTQTGAGRNYTGDGIGVMVRDDGNVGPHIDFEGRITNMATGSGTHGDRVAGVLCGAGNLNAEKRGMAAGAELYVVSYASSFLDVNTTTLINDGSVQITNSSYGDGCNDGYTTTAQTVDTQINVEPTLLHVFSCGNSGGSNCGYGAGSGWGNITGGHKQGKNVIASASSNAIGLLAGSSSRGPATDGRIKPDLASQGAGISSTLPNNTYISSTDGTSFASPGVAGVAAQLYEAYADANGGALPQSALIKATMLNTAQDKGNVGPDFKWGWGLVHGLRAGKLIEDGRYLSDNITQGNSNNHVINVPAGTKQVRFMVYWNDPAGVAGANPALVNDLDVVVTDPGATDHLPWLLDHTPNATALDTPATNGVDHLNNMEQVLLNDPAAGNYTVEVTGFNVPVGPQEYFVVYEIISENVTVTYPNSGEKFTPGTTEIIHWDGINTVASFDVEYSTDNGSNWNTIANVPAANRTHIWSVPAEITGEALIRVTSGAFTDTSDGNFSIASQVTGLSVVQVCDDNTATFEWDAVTDAESYDLYILGEKFMEVVGNSATNSITVPIDNYLDPMWYAVSAKNASEGWESFRSLAVNYAGGELNCVLSVEDLQLNNIVMYPNPATQQVSITFDSSFIDSLEVTITNSLGQILQRVDETSNGSNVISLNVSNLNTGLYFVTIKNGNQTTTKKLLVK
jgi:hypothetical protein